MQFYIFLYRISRMQVHQMELEKERHMKDEKNSAVRPLYEVADSVNPDQILEIVNKSVRVRKSHLQDPSLETHRARRHKGNCKKNRFRDLEEAIETLHRIERYRRYSSEAGLSKSHRKEQRAYKCPICLGAHLTSQAEQGLAVNYVAA